MLRELVDRCKWDGRLREIAMRLTFGVEERERMMEQEEAFWDDVGLKNRVSAPMLTQFLS